MIATECLVHQDGSNKSAFSHLPYPCSGKCLISILVTDYIQKRQGQDLLIYSVQQTERAVRMEQPVGIFQPNTVQCAYVFLERSI